MIARLVLMVAILALAVFNGILSPRSFQIFALQGIWNPLLLYTPFNMMLFSSGVISSLLHLLITGIPAAILEKAVSLDRFKAGLVWLAVLLLPTYQTLRHLGWL